MKKSICPLCRKEFISKQKTYCSNRCQDKARKHPELIADFEFKNTCPFNSGVVCSNGYSKKCDKCGWFPNTEKSRKKEFSNE